MGDKFTSHFDFDLRFRAKKEKIDSEKKEKIEDLTLNSLGIEDSQFHKWMKEWKEKNL